MSNISFSSSRTSLTGSTDSINVEKFDVVYDKQGDVFFIVFTSVADFFL
jgi:hypothetical protein